MGSLICVGTILGAFGVSGQVRLRSHCEIPEAIADYGTLSTQDNARHFDIRIFGNRKNFLIAEVKNLQSREEAEQLKGTRLFADRARFPETGEDEFYHADIIGLSVYDQFGSHRGEIRSVENYGAGDLLEIESANGTELIPFTREAVPDIDIGQGRAVVEFADQSRGSGNDLRR
ncbi:MAG: ribosome maturation factor RimM [Rhodobacteraceae bacterium]|nr:ribosome maturation factor RimM [Paracoccaceae bacterium]